MDSLRVSTLVYASLLFICLTLPQCISQKYIDRKKISWYRTSKPTLHPTHNTPPPINIWIHGTCFMYRPSFYSAYNGKASLKPAPELSHCYYLRGIADTLYTHSPHTFPLETCYLFGWSGKLSTAAREEAALLLYEELTTLINQYKIRYNTNPFIRIIAHSHGGNVALSLAKMVDIHNPACVIDELVLLACPVQTKTAHAIKHSMFKKIYVLYSSLDMIQILAPNLTRNYVHPNGERTRPSINFLPLSARRFPPHPHIMHVKIKINGRAITHSEFCMPPFVALLPKILTTLDAWYNQPPFAYAKEKLLCTYTYEQYTSKSVHVPS